MTKNYGEIEHRRLTYRSSCIKRIKIIIIINNYGIYLLNKLVKIC